MEKEIIIMASMGWKKRLAIVFSFLWLIIAVAISASEQDSFTKFVVSGVLPLSITWGIAWVWWGFLSRQKLPASLPQNNTVSSLINTSKDKLAANIGETMESNIAENKTTENRASFVVRLFRGDIPLPITYWVFFVLIGLGFRIINELIELNNFEIMSTTAGELSVMGFYLFTIGYSIFILIAIWRSAVKYKGRAIWGNLARVLIIVGALMLFIFIGNSVIELQQSGDKTLAFNEGIKMLNKSLPSKIDDETRIDHVSIQDRDIYYNYTLVNLLSADMDISRFTTVMTPKLKTSTCADKETRSMLNEGRKLIYVYRDKMGKSIAQIAIEKLDCM